MAGIHHDHAVVQVGLQHQSVEFVDDILSRRITHDACFITEAFFENISDGHNVVDRRLQRRYWCEVAVVTKQQGQLALDNRFRIASDHGLGLGGFAFHHAYARAVAALGHIGHRGIQGNLLQRRGK